MKFLTEYRDARLAAGYLAEIEKTVRRPHSIMEVCGGQTHAIVKHGIDRLLPRDIRLLHGPGCPVCITPTGLIDSAIGAALTAQVILCSFGDMLRVPGSHGDLLAAKASGADVRAVYSPLDSVLLAGDHPEREVVFFAVGFETTAPAIALAVQSASRLGLTNYSILPALARVHPAVEALLSDPDCVIDGLLAAGHVCTVAGYREYERIARQYGVPIVVTGFEPVDILQGLLMTVAQLERGLARVENQYARAVRPNGNQAAIDMVEEVFCIVDREWRGLGCIRAGGLSLAPGYARFDARNRFNMTSAARPEDGPCISGAVLQGKKKPCDCTAFGAACTPEHPLGATMVSSEGACAAYYLYRDARLDPDRSVQEHSP